MHTPIVSRALYLEEAFWMLPGQVPPRGDWHSWLFLGGRGAGKTFAGSRWLHRHVAKGVRIALIGPSLHDVREVIIEGPSGLIASADDDNRPRYEPSRRRVLWPRGGVAYAFSAEDPESLRGPQFHYAWADEFASWRGAGETLALLRMGLRLGERPRLCVTTTPRPVRALRQLMAEAGVVVTRAKTVDNVTLPVSFVETLEGLYGGTRLAAQELEGLVVEGDERPLWRADDLLACRGVAPERLDRIVVAVDPPITDHGDACGIVVVGYRDQASGVRRGYVIEDASVRGFSPGAWAARVVECVLRHGADAVVAEGNQGGDMVRTVLVAGGCTVPVDIVHARIGKRARAEPVAALYEQGRVTHAGIFVALEEELMSLGAGELVKSPDRADALVWGLTALLVEGRVGPRLRRL